MRISRSQICTAYWEACSFAHRRPSSLCSKDRWFADASLTCSAFRRRVLTPRRSAVVLWT